MAKNKPIITHTRVLCYAILYLQSQIDDMKKKCEGTPGCDVLLKGFMDTHAPELDALKEMYRIETGVEYV